MDNAVYSLSEDSNDEIELLSRQAWLKLLQMDLFTDAILQTENGEKFTVHRSILCLCSPYFKALFTRGMQREERSWTSIPSRDKKAYTIPGITANELKAIIDYAYSGRIFISKENVKDILIGADQFLVFGLLKDCCDFLLCNLTFQNCISIREFARNFYCFELEETAERFLMSHFVEVSGQSEEFLDLPIEKIAELLNSDRINVKSEEQVWEAGLRWINHCPDKRSQHIDTIMRCVRLGLLDAQYFLDTVKSNKYVVENADLCRQTVIETLRFLWDLEMIGSETESIETPFLATPRIPNSILFTIGGWSAGSPTNLIEAYDTKADRWVQVDAGDPAGPRAYHKLAVVGHNIYVIGGFNGNDYFNSCRCFNAVTKEWKDIAPMHTRRCYVSVATLDNLIYAMGGFDGHRRQNTTERFDYHTNQWTQVAPMNVQRSDACATTLNGFIYIVGGFNGIECLSSSEFYNPAVDQWTTLVPMHQRRSGVSIISHHGKIYAIGGFNGISRLPNAEKFDPETEQWTEVPDMFNPRSNFAVEIIDDMIFAIGGFNGMNTIYHVECFNDHKNEWYEATDMSQFRSALAACIVHDLPNVDDYIYQNRRGLMEEKRQRLLQQRSVDLERAHLTAGAHAVMLPQIEGREEEL